MAEPDADTLEWRDAMISWQEQQAADIHSIKVMVQFFFAMGVIGLVFVVIGAIGAAS